MVGGAEVHEGEYEEVERPCIFLERTQMKARAVLFYTIERLVVTTVL